MSRLRRMTKQTKVFPNRFKIIKTPELAAETIKETVPCSSVVFCGLVVLSVKTEMNKSLSLTWQTKRSFIKSDAFFREDFQYLEKEKKRCCTVGIC